MAITPKQEIFCQCIAKGMTQADAYREAYDVKNMQNESVWSLASRLMDNVKVKSRVDELKKEVVKGIQYSVNESFCELDDIHKEALASGNLNVAVRAVELKGKMMGLYTEKREETLKFTAGVKFEVADGKANNGKDS